MSLQTWRETLTTATAAGTLFNTYTTAKTVIRPENLVVLPAGYFYVGRKLHIKLQGALSNIVTTPGTVTMQVMLGATGTIVAFTTGAMQLSTTAHTTLPFNLEIDLTCRSVGSGTAATLIGQGNITSQCVSATAVADSTTSHNSLMCPNTAPAVGTGFDSTIANVLDFWAGFSISNAGNGIQIHQYDIYSEN
jgi:hypothetical protein